jgi:hypothetical protein
MGNKKQGERREARYKQPDNEKWTKKWQMRSWATGGSGHKMIHQKQDIQHLSTDAGQAKVCGLH